MGLHPQRQGEQQLRDVAPADLGPGNELLARVLQQLQQSGEPLRSGAGALPPRRRRTVGAPWLLLSLDDVIRSPSGSTLLLHGSLTPSSADGVFGVAVLLRVQSGRSVLRVLLPTEHLYSSLSLHQAGFLEKE